MLGFTEEPIWWKEVYGIAPYTSDNLVLWNDIKEGIIREPNKPVVKNEKYAKPFILETQHHPSHQDQESNPDNHKHPT